MTNATQGALLNPLTEKVGAVAVSRSLARYPQLRAVIMIGSMARSEATWKRSPVGWEVLGDAEFVIIHDNARTGANELADLCFEIEQALATEQISCKIDMSLVDCDWLANLGTTIFTYEIRTTGRVVYGDPSLLKLIRDFPCTAIDREDAWRLICNRLVEWLEAIDDVSQSQYRSAKLLLDCAASLLVFTDRFEAGYENRVEKIRSLDKVADLDLDFRSFSNLVSVCTDYKLGRRNTIPDLKKISPTVALRLAEWELKQINTRPGVATRLRAWAYVARASGWFKEVSRWPRWSILALYTTPRRIVYQAALQVVRAMLEEISFPEALKSVTKLPIAPSHKVESYSDACKQIAFNYNEFVLKSRA